MQWNMKYITIKYTASVHHSKHTCFTSLDFLKETCPLISYLFGWRRATLLQFEYVLYWGQYTCSFLDVYSFFAYVKTKIMFFECFGTKKDSQPIQEKSHSVSTSPWLLSGEGTKLWGCLDKHPQHFQRSVCCPLVKSLSAKSEKNKSG